MRYSILIPTFNKIKYLKFTINSVLSQGYNNFELIVSDDCSNDGTYKYLEEIKDKRLKIFKTPNRLGQAGNYEYILNKAKGDWVFFIGDDDGITPDFFQTTDNILKKIKYKNIEIIKFGSAHFYWDNVEDWYGDRVVDYRSQNSCLSLLNLKFRLLLALSGLIGLKDLPSIYTSSIIKKKLIEKIKKKSGNFFFHSLVPDYYSCIALSMEQNNYYFCKRPIFWIGTSRYSTGRSTRIYKNNHKRFILSDNVSHKIHKLGINSFYFFEAILKHPYAKNFWKSNFIRCLVYVSAYLDFKNKIKYYPKRLKIKITENLFLKELNKEKINYKINETFYRKLYLIVYMLYGLNKLIRYGYRLVYKVERFLFQRLLIVSKDRKKFPNLDMANLELRKYVQKD
jgi:glycosyltransferase involved in cell wall biosynthesis